MNRTCPALLALAAAAALGLSACKGDAGAAGAVGPSGPTGPTGPSGPPGASTGTLAGQVTIAGTTPALPVAGAAVALSPAVTGVTITTDASGNYSAVVPVGLYSVTYSATNFTSQSASVSVTAGQTATRNVALAATAPVIVSIAVTGTAAPGATLSATATVTPLDGSTVTAGSASWTQVDGAPVAFSAPTAGTTNVTLGTAADYKVQVFKALTVSPLQDLDDDPASGGEGGTPFLGGLQDRFKVQAINHADVERAGEVTLQYQVATSSGTWSATSVVSTAIPWKPATGLPEVPLGEPLIVHGKNQAAWNYTLTVPTGSTATLDDAVGQNPSFTPDVKGSYTLTETTSAQSLTIVAGTWVGELDAAGTLAGLDASGQGLPVGSADCTVCHDGTIAPDKFTPWSMSGHAGIFTQNVNAGGHYVESCFDCHTVGWDKSVVNGGIDEKSDYAQMLAGIFVNHGSPNADPLNWKNVLTSYPATAAMTNIQCENCHGPNSPHDRSAAELARRVSLDAGVCARCHGEPARHGRYQEWQLSGHANYSTAIGEGFDSTGAIRGSCASCHTAQGALLYFDQLQSGNASRTLTAASLAQLTGMTPDNVQPQTCAVCHDPHNPGTVSSLANDVTPRINGDTPLLPGGFQAIGVGKGAMCITCHNSRNGEAVSGSGVVSLHEDGDTTFGTLAGYSAPHEACQGDVLMGRNAYFVQGERSAHSNIVNTCTTCHMELEPPPPLLGYPTQTNHVFTANLSICSNCHGSYDGAGLQSAVASELAALKAAVESAVSRVYASGAAVVFTPGRTPTLSVGGAAAVPFTTVVPVAGNPVNTDLFAKANWNYSLVANDDSFGVHNPSFVHALLFATTGKMSGITTAQ